MNVTFRSFATFPRPQTIGRKSGAFRVDYTTALKHLCEELAYLGAKSVIIATGHTSADIRNDGWPRSTAKRPTHPGVVLYFRTKHGDLSFVCDTYSDWQSNIRALGLTLEYLRAVERYGALRGGEQYRGFAAIPPNEEKAEAPPTANVPQDEVRNRAARTLLHYGGYELTATNRQHVLHDSDMLDSVYRSAVKRAHPDQGGTAEAFQAVRQAWDVLRRSAK